MKNRKKLGVITVLRIFKRASVMQMTINEDYLLWRPPDNEFELSRRELVSLSSVAMMGRKNRHHFLECGSNCAA